MSPQVLSSVIRLSTHPRVCVSPSRLEDALAFARVLLAQPHCTPVTPGARHFTIFDDLCRASAVAGNLVQDARFAALALDWIQARPALGNPPTGRAGVVPPPRRL